MLLAFAAVGLPAQTLPATPPTSTPSASQNSPAPPDTPLHAQVTFAHGELQVRADNSSLNQILRSISHQTGLKITGGVAEQRVFGTYGPAPMSTVLATLLDGTGTNILLLGGDANTPPELILTPRNGAPALPGPDSPTYAMYDDATDPQPPVPPPAAVREQAPFVSNAPPRATQPEPPHAPNPPPTASSAAASPAKTLTPEMVMQELLQMQKQQTQQKQEFDRQTQKEQLDQNRKLRPKPNPQSRNPQTPSGSSNPQ